MLSLDPRAAAIVHALKRGQKPYGDLVAEIDGLTRDDLTVRVHRINREAGYELVVSKTIDGDRLYSLADPGIECRTLSATEDAVRDLSRLSRETNWKLVAVFLLSAIAFGVLSFFLGYYVGTANNIEVSIDSQEIADIIIEKLPQ